MTKKKNKKVTPETIPEQVLKTDKPKKQHKKFKELCLPAYLGRVNTELHRVTWPTKKEVAQSSALVYVALVAFGVFVYLIDTAMVPLLGLWVSL